jgi:iron complex outermembrane receptor protein
MEKKIVLSFATALLINANAQDLGTIEVKEKVNTKVVNNISTQEVKNADLAEALAKKSASISLIRRSGIANDIVLRGQKRDNIKVTIDDGMVCGACPNRMDPPTSHVITTMVDSVEIKEGPFDVTEFGTLSGGVKIKTVQPQEGLHGEIGTTIGSYGYKKGVLSVSGGNDKIKALVTYSKEESDQYEDGDGNTMAEQTFNAVNGTPAAGTRYAPLYTDMKAYEKQSIMAKAIANITDNQELEISATQNRSDDILYPSSKMDALYDDSNLYNIKYTAKELGNFSKKLEVKAYKTDVDHPMSTQYRVAGATTSMVNHLTTDVTGAKIINTFDAIGQEFDIGLDTSKRNWDGRYYNSAGINMGKSIDDVDTKNNALFVKSTNKMDKLILELGARYDSTKIKSSRTASYQQDNKYNGLSGNIIATYNSDENTKYFVGLGQASRVPDARELYNLGNSMNPATQLETGTPNLKETKNRELDLGTEHHYKNGKIKAKFFYSDLKDYIYYRQTPAANRFENIDAKIYGMELSGAYYINDQFTFDGGYTWKKGKKDRALSGQTDTDLADITPPKLTLALTYDHNANTNAMIEFVNVSSWNNYDADNGEQHISGYNVVNLKAQTTVAKNFEITLGIDNLFDKTYAVSNTYADLILLTDGTTNDVMLLNEPGRYIYTSLKYKF